MQNGNDNNCSEASHAAGQEHTGHLIVNIPNTPNNRALIEYQVIPALQGDPFLVGKWQEWLELAKAQAVRMQRPVLSPEMMMTRVDHDADASPVEISTTSSGAATPTQKNVATRRLSVAERLSSLHIEPTNASSMVYELRDIGASLGNSAISTVVLPKQEVEGGGQVDKEKGATSSSTVDINLPPERKVAPARTATKIQSSGNGNPAKDHSEPENASTQ